MNPRLASFLKYMAGPVVITLIGLIVALRFVEPAPPKTIVFAAGQSGGAYYQTAIAYRDALAAYDIEVEVIETAGSVENISRLSEDSADVALIQAGIANADDEVSLRALGAMFFEPLWIFVRADLAADDLGDLRGVRMAIGPEGSGTRALVDRIRLEWGAVWPQAASLPLGSREALAALQDGEIDAAAFVASVDASYVGALLSDRRFTLLPFERGPALARRIPYLAQVPLLRGVADVGADIPAADIPLVATSAMLVVDEDTHPAIQAVLLDAARDIQRTGTLMSAPGTFPNRDFVDLPLSKEAERYYERGPSVLRRIFPFGLANFLERAWVLAIPLLTLAIPLVRIAPPLYRWRIRRKIYVWYRDLRDLETRGRHAESHAEREIVIGELAKIQAATGKVEVPLSYTDDLYRLRNHIAFVTNLMERLDAGEKV